MSPNSRVSVSLRLAQSKIAILPHAEFYPPITIRTRHEDVDRADSAYNSSRGNNSKHDANPALHLETVTMSQSKSNSDKPPISQQCVVAAGVVIPFLGCVAAIVLMWWLGWMGWLYLGLFLGGWLITGLGVTVGLHRLLTHRSFETPRWVRAFWSALGATAAEGPPLMWCATHRMHHELSDQDGDPHSPHQHGAGWWSAIRGFVHAHVGWFFTHNANAAMLKRYVPDLLKDRLLVRVSRLYVVWILIGLCLPALIGLLVTGSWTGALLGLLWGGLARIFFVHHVTWSINSICHMFGRRDYASTDHSRNNFLCGVLGHGEGWHNNHHAFPTSARHGLRWWQFDLSWFVIRAMQFFRLARDIRIPSQKALQAKRLVGSH